MKKRLQLVIPWILALVILVFLLKQTPPQELLPIIKEAPLVLLVMMPVIYFVIMLVLDCLGLYWTIGRFGTPVSFKETILMRGITYLIMLTNYMVGQSSIAFYLKRTKNIPLFKSMGVIFYLMLIDFALMALFCLVAVIIYDVSYKNYALRPFIISFTSLFYLFLLLWGLFWRHLQNHLVKHLSHWRFIQWILAHDTFSIFVECSLKDYLKIFLLRLPAITWVFFSIYLSLIIFKSLVPWSDLFTYTPIIILIGGLPITPAGLGTVQALNIEFFSLNLNSPFLSTYDFKAGDIILAASLYWVFANLLLKFIFGLYCLKKRSRHLFKQV